MTTDTNGAGGLPELPEPVLTAYTKKDGVTPFWKYDGMPMAHEGRRDDSGTNKAIHLYTADQMRAYVELCRATREGDVEAEPEDCAKCGGAGGNGRLYGGDAFEPSKACDACAGTGRTLSRVAVQEGQKVERVRIENPPGLDPITVYLEDYGNGQGRAVIVCYSSAWTCFWGAMGDRTIREFIADCDEHYVSGVMTSMSYTRVTKSAQEYATRVARAVIDAIAAQRQEGGSNG